MWWLLVVVATNFLAVLAQADSLANCCCTHARKPIITVLKQVTLRTLAAAGGCVVLNFLDVSG